MRVLFYITVSVLAILPVSPARAHDTFFLPGDAFFSTSITRNVISEWTNNKGPEFEVKYSRFDGKFLSPGSLGYKSLRLRGIDGNFRKSLSEAYWRFTALHRPLFRLESDDREDLTQVNGVVALIYTRDFSGPLGLKFNENWQMEGLRQYSGFFTSAEPVVSDWKFGPEFRPLQLATAVPPLAHIPVEGEERLAMETPLTVNSSQVKVVLAGFAQQDGLEEKQTCPNLQKIFEATPRTEFIEVDQKGFTVFTCNEKGEWQKTRTEVSGN